VSLLFEFEKLCEEVSSVKHFNQETISRFSDYCTNTPIENLKREIKTILSQAHNRGSSLIHENGFSKISVIKSVDNEMQLRLHFWPKGAKDVSIHNHRWDLFGYCISGNLKLNNYSLLDSEENPRTVTRLSDADKNLVKCKQIIGTRDIAIQTIYQLRQGSFHFLESSVFHNVEVVSDSFTLFLSGPVKKMYSDVIYLVDSPAKRKKLNSEEINTIAEML